MAQNSYRRCNRYLPNLRPTLGRSSSLRRKSWANWILEFPNGERYTCRHPDGNASVSGDATNLTVGSRKMSLASGELLTYVANMSSTQGGLIREAAHRTGNVLVSTRRLLIIACGGRSRYSGSEPLLFCLKDLPMGRWCSRLFTQFCAWFGEHCQRSRNGHLGGMRVTVRYWLITYDPAQKRLRSTSSIPSCRLKWRRGIGDFIVSISPRASPVSGVRETAPWTAFTSVKKRWKAGRVSG